MFQNYFSRLFDIALNKLSYNILEQLHLKTLKLLNKHGTSFITYQKRPKLANDISFDIQENIYSEFAIILQGPIILEENFTIETIKIYKKHFPKATIIVSSWEDTNSDVINIITKLDVVFLSNKKPPFRGHQNINLQITSTLNGLIETRNLGIKYVAKTRTDQRLYDPYFLNAIVLLNSLKVTNPIYNLNNKLIVCSMNTLKYRPYGVSDMFMLGLTEDLLKYWNSPIDERIINVIEKEPTIKQYAKYELTETYILANFLKRQNIQLDFSLKQTWQVYQDIFLILNKASFNIYWFKYSSEKENRLSFYEEHIYKEIDHIEALLLNNKLKAIEIKLESKLIKYSP